MNARDLRFPIAYAIGIARAKGFTICGGAFFTDNAHCCPIGAVLVAGGHGRMNYRRAMPAASSALGVGELEIHLFAEAFDDPGINYPSSMGRLGASFRRAVDAGQL